MSILALKKEYEPQWPDMPRESIYQERDEYKEKLRSGKNPLPEKMVLKFMAELDREHGI